MSFFGTLIEGENKAISYEYNAKVARMNAEIARQQGVAAVEAQQREGARAMGRAMAAYGASGVQMDSGSPVDVLVDSARNIELDRLTVQYNYALKAVGYESDAKMDLLGAKSARTSSYIKAANQLMGADYSSFGSFAKTS